MASKLSKYVLGLLHKQPMNPYELIKLSDMEVIKTWFPMTSTSIYTTIKNLEKTGLIRGKVIQEGNFPSKTLYSITEAGIEELIQDLSEDIASYEAQASNFGIAIFHICSLSKENAERFAIKRLDKLIELEKEATTKYVQMAEKIPFNMRIMLKYKLNRLNMEIETTKELIIEIKSDEKWDYSFAQLINKKSKDNN